MSQLLNREHNTDDKTPLQQPLSRRAFIAGSTSLAAGALVGGALAGCSSSSSTADTTTTDSSLNSTADSNDVPVLMVDSSEILSFEDFEQLDATDRYTVAHTYTLPLGSMVWRASEGLAVVMGIGETSSPLSQVKMLDLDTGSLTTIISQAIGVADGYELYDVRASSSTIAWTEYDYATADWRLYAATLNSTATGIGDAYKLDEGDENWDTPLICVAEDQVYWTRLPYENGLYTSGSSYLRKSDARGSDVTDVYTSQGRLITIPQYSEGVVTFVPRLASSNVYYQMTAMNTSTDEIVLQATLPSGVKVMDAIYMQGAFSFCVEANYDSTSAIATMGTYRNLTSGDYFQMNRTPSCTPAICGGKFIVKLGKSTAVVDIANKQYYTIAAPAYSWSYGDYLASSGVCDSLVVYSTVDTASDVSSAYVQLRVLTLN